MKPTGLGPFLQTRHPSKTEDRIWEAIEEAIDAGWTPQQFRNEVASAWGNQLRERAKDAEKILEAQ